MIAVEDKLVALLLCMSKIKRSLTSSEGLRLANELIEGTAVQQQLVQWKMNKKVYNRDMGALGTVGMGYWRNFLL